MVACFLFTSSIPLSGSSTASLVRVCLPACFGAFAPSRHRLGCPFSFLSLLTQPGCRRSLQKPPVTTPPQEEPSLSLSRTHFPYTPSHTLVDPEVYHRVTLFWLHLVQRPWLSLVGPNPTREDVLAHRTVPSSEIQCPLCVRVLRMS